MTGSIKIDDMFSSILDSFCGVYSSRDSQINKFKQDILDDIEMPNPSRDKLNLRDDLNNVIKDTNKSYFEILNRK